DEVDGRRPRRIAGPSGVGDALGRRPVRDHRQPSLRLLPERAHDSQGGVRSGASRGGDRLPRTPRGGLRRHGDRGSRDGAGPGACRTRGGAQRGAPRDRPGGGARRPCAPARPLVAAGRAVGGRGGGPRARMRSLSLRNGQRVALRDVPVLRVDEFRHGIITDIADGARLAAFFGHPRRGEGLGLIAVLAYGTEAMLSVSSTIGADAYPALTPECAPAPWFERELGVQWDVRPEGHPWLEPIGPGGGAADFFRVEGEELREVGVGPVHAGIIEPGHFRFQCHGENVLHLEISLGYQHRGVERALVGGPGKRTIHYMETLAGDT